MNNNGKDKYYELLYDIKKVDLLKKTGFLVDKLTMERCLYIVIKVIINMIGDLFEKLRYKYDIDENDYYEFLENFKKQVNVILEENNLKDIGIIDNDKGV